MPARLIFDLDGTISDPAVGIARSFNYALEHFGHRPISEASVSPWIGPPLDHSFRLLTGVSAPEHIAQLVAKYRERYAEVGYSENVLYAGIPEALASLAGAGIELALCTSKRIDFAEAILGMFGLRQYFVAVSGGDIGIQKQQQLAALLAQGAVTTSALMIGDRAVDVESAHANRLEAVGVLWGHGAEEELLAAKPSRLLRQPCELLALRQAA
jgi:phosphoglycolate phosphatase